MIADNRVGTVLTMSNGMRCTCIEYRNNQDCDFKFEDGAVVENKRWVNFLNGQIAHPNIKTTGFSANEKTLLQILKPYGFINMPKGEIKELHGLELDLYNPNLNGHKVAIEYDGEHWHQNIERDIKKDNLCIKAGIELFRIREGNLPELKTSICIKNNDTTRFSDTFFDATNELINMLNKEYDCNISLVSKEDICEENITTMFATYQSKIGVTLMMNNGMDCTCIAYRGTKDCDFQFKDGTIVKHKFWSNFINGEIGNVNKFNERINTSLTMNNGLKCTCITYRNHKDCDFQFENGDIVVGKSWYLFSNKSLPLPKTSDRIINKRIGTTLVMKNGLKATCIDYRNSLDCDFRFENGTIIKHKSWHHFKRGEVGDSNYYKKERIGTTFVMNNGMKATCIDYRNSLDCDIQFEDGMIVKHKRWDRFKNGNIGYPKEKELTYENAIIEEEIENDDYER